MRNVAGLDNDAFLRDDRTDLDADDTRDMAGWNHGGGLWLRPLR